MDIKSVIKACSQLRQESTISDTSSTAPTTATLTTVAPTTGIQKFNLSLTIKGCVRVCVCHIGLDF